MVVESDGYNALIEYFIDNLSVFSSKDERVGSETIDELVHELVASQIMAICDQNQRMPQSMRFEVMSEADKIVADLEEVLSSVWNQKPTYKQVSVLEKYIGLVKNLFDAAVSECA
ncbi:DUF3802 family protein [Enterovibrio nigricans]|uniref:Type IIA topoisomerase, B subunit n=1 Tax=Enterovibrio nigricans DSM 22720 TaxID=1121868 RepID=A0A1T4ULE7_9GAMM|nr:DUF3802 family protein [Enterovibrio nigricans]PKF49464.1 DUF3802 domain-containing protein [Enterovibrio nigricans]SKA53420.1 Protein of unknown function [Enterovibrio nigricans DSM 22720]